VLTVTFPGFGFALAGLAPVTLGRALLSRRRGLLERDVVIITKHVVFLLPLFLVIARRLAQHHGQRVFVRRLLARILGGVARGAPLVRLQPQEERALLLLQHFVALGIANINLPGC
jgi:hypothetical protein